jgi:ABC-type phosphate transport system permease subunit
MFALVFYTGVYYQKQKTSEEKQAVDILPAIPYGVAGIWGLIIIIKGVLI